MIGLTMAAMPMAPQRIYGPRCRAFALRIERTSRIASSKIQASYAANPSDPELLMLVRQIRAAQAIVKAIRARYPGLATAIPEIDRMHWSEALAEGEACRDRKD